MDSKAQVWRIFGSDNFPFPKVGILGFPWRAYHWYFHLIFKGRFHRGLKGGPTGSFTHLLKEVGSVSTMICKGAVTIHPRLNFSSDEIFLEYHGIPISTNEFSGDCLGFVKPSRVLFDF